MPEAFDMDIAGGDILFLFLFGSIYFIAIFIIEKYSHISCRNENKILYEPKEYDDDVQREIDDI